MFNMKALAQHETFTLHLRHPVTMDLLYADEEETQPVTIEVFGTSTKQYRNAVNAMHKRNVKAGYGQNKPIPPDVLRDENDLLLAACSSHATNFDYDDQPLDNVENFRAMYADSSFNWIREQVDSAIGSTANFIRA